MGGLYTWVQPSFWAQSSSLLCPISSPSIDDSAFQGTLGYDITLPLCLHCSGDGISRKKWPQEQVREAEDSISACMVLGQWTSVCHAGQCDTARMEYNSTALPLGPSHPPPNTEPAFSVGCFLLVLLYFFRPTLLLLLLHHLWG